jgi:hypothetical protein
VAARRGARRAGGERERLPEGVEEAADELYGLPPDQFVPRRKELAKELRGSGDRAAAGAVEKLRKPTLPAWTVNQLARRQELDVRRLLKAGESLRKRSKDAESFREARLEEGSMIRRLVTAAREILEDEGRSPSDTTLATVANLLRSAAIDESSRDLLAKGRLTGDIAPADSFDLLSAALPKQGSRARKGKQGASNRSAQRRAEQEAREAEQLQRDLADAEQRLAEAERSFQQAEKQLAEQRKKAKQARDRSRKRKA